MSDTPQNNEQQAELMRCISRLSFVGMGLSAPLDTALKELRNQIKKQESPNSIKKQIDKISRKLRQLEDKKSSLEKIELNQELDILEQLLDRTLPKDLKRTLKRIEKKRRSLESAKLIASIADSIESYVASNKAEKRSGIMSRLFKRQDGELTEEESLNESKIPTALKISLVNLIDQLSSIEGNRARIQNLSKKIDEAEKTEDLIEVLEILTGAFIDISGDEHRQLESFLKTLTKRIDRVNEFLSQTVNYNQQFRTESEQLDDELKLSVNTLKDSLSGTTSLAEIKQNLSEKLEAIVSKVNVFCEHQLRTQNQLNESCNKLKEQLSATNDETTRLKDELAAQRMRAQTDPLTGLPNRYSYNERLTQEYNRWRRYRSPLSLVVGDIDYFKTVNDNYGHEMGDAVLQKVANFMQSELRESDFIARYGGEEFVLLLPETSLIDATKAVNKLRQGVKELNIDIDGRKIRVAMSFGISEFENNDTTKAVFGRADEALYRAKNKGRDQVCCQRAKPAKE
ncbi:GGDEF domain-containing protein [Aliikangiella sp. G2MR2-5]|uniref:GGDEF domain-containing protein n=1 Tax=Aliikangiella sp. G2MR2-5 TaxID=2788943 RepID=UPI0018AC1CF0|nr:GGDEF domain-containing protein [Aliikangiella sp. G2MR2-5]